MDDRLRYNETKTLIQCSDTDHEGFHHHVKMAKFATRNIRYIHDMYMQYIYSISTNVSELGKYDGGLVSYVRVRTFSKHLQC